MNLTQSSLNPFQASSYYSNQSNCPAPFEPSLSSTCNGGSPFNATHSANFEPDNSTSRLAFVTGKWLRASFDLVYTTTSQYLRFIVDKPVVDKPVADEPVADEPVVDKPVPEKRYAFQENIDKLVADLTARGWTPHHVDHVLSLVTTEEQLSTLRELIADYPSLKNQPLLSLMLQSIGVSYLSNHNIKLVVPESADYNQQERSHLYSQQIIEFLKQTFSNNDLFIQQYFVARCLGELGRAIVYDPNRALLPEKTYYRAAYATLGSQEVIAFTEHHDFYAVLEGILHHEMEHCGWHQMFNNVALSWPTSNTTGRDALQAASHQILREFHVRESTVSRRVQQYQHGERITDQEKDQLFQLFDEAVLGGQAQATLRFFWPDSNHKKGEMFNYLNHSFNVLGHLFKGGVIVETDYDTQRVDRDNSSDEFLFALALLNGQNNLIKDALHRLGILTNGSTIHFSNAPLPFNAPNFSASPLRDDQLIEMRPHFRSNVEHFIPEALLKPLENYTLQQIQLHRTLQTATCEQSMRDGEDEASLKRACLTSGAIVPTTASW